jgi:16S rRNA (adenine1518-N6/adenine1519-N6)-dimethyltransferase
MARAKKRFGQHFLERAWAEKLVAAIAPAPSDTFVEIGPGTGALTRPLAAAAAHVVAYEIDRDLASTLRDAAIPRVTIVERDFLQVSAADVAGDLAAAAPPARTRVAGNLPYNVASPILFKLCELFAAGVALADATVMVQQEVADRLLAAPGGREYGVLTVLISWRATVERVLKLPPGAFRPQPQVHSAVVRLSFHAPEPLPRDAAVFVGITRAVFSRRRKTLSNALLAWPGADKEKAAAMLDAAGLDHMRRPETLSVAELVTLADAATGLRAVSG